MRVQVLRRLLHIAQGIEPGAILAADPVDQLLSDERVQRTVNRDRIDRTLHLSKNLRDGQRPPAAGKRIDYPHPHGRAAKAATLKHCLRGGNTVGLHNIDHITDVSLVIVAGLFIAGRLPAIRLYSQVLSAHPLDAMILAPEIEN
jgi:hypothetical protein